MEQSGCVANDVRRVWARPMTSYGDGLTADLGEDDHFSLLRQGSVRVVLKFAAPLAATISVIAHAEFENVIEVDRDRNIIFDFGV